MANPYLYASLQTGCRTMNSVENPLGSCLPIRAKPVDYEKEGSQSVVVRQNEKKEAKPFPKIVEVFSLNPSLPVQIFRDHVTLTITPNEIGQSLENKTCKETEKETFYNRSGTNSKGGRILADYDKKFMQDFQTIERQKILRDTNSQTNQHVFVTDYIDTLRVSEKEAQTSSLSEGHSVDEWLQISSNCTRSEDDSTAKNEGICTAEVMVTARRQNVLEQIINDIHAEKKRNRRKRRAMFGLNKTERSKKRCLVSDFYHHVKENDQYLPDEQLINDTENDKCSQFERCSSFNDTETTNVNKNSIGIQERSKAHENASQEYNQDINYPLTVRDEENITNPIPGQTEVSSTDSAESNDDSGSFPSVTISPFHGNDTRQSKILCLKEKLAKQEQELQNLKRRKDTEVIEKEGCQPYAEQQRASSMEMNVREFLEDGTMFDLSLQKDGIFCAQDNEIEEDLNLGKIEDLKHIFQNVIKSFSKILDCKLHSTRIIPNYAHLQTSNYAFGGNYRCVFAGIDNQMMPEDFASKEEFLLQLGLLRI